MKRAGIVQADNSLDITAFPDDHSRWTVFRGLVNVRDVYQPSPEYLLAEESLLQAKLAPAASPDQWQKSQLDQRIFLWQGDITRLKVDAIVNAANSGMTGCYVPNHRCIDNCIHSFSGIQLRLECAEIMERQGHEEETGKAKLTKAYNLPCRYILHTVGPIIRGELTEEDCDLLRQCYDSCLALAAENRLESVAFCCISTGEFHFPNDKAAQIAVNTVKKYMQKGTSVKKVVFNVFKDLDREIYSRLLG